jgi:hypothetical protein
MLHQIIENMLCNITVGDVVGIAIVMLIAVIVVMEMPDEW